MLNKSYFSPAQKNVLLQTKHTDKKITAAIKKNIFSTTAAAYILK